MKQRLSTTKRLSRLTCIAQDSPQTVQPDGFALPMAIGLGLCMMAIATTTILMAQEDRNNAAQRKESAASLLISDSAIAEVLTALSQTENAVLLGKDYDPLNPKTGAPYLGNDGMPNSGDEKSSNPTDEWTSLPFHQCQSELGLAQPNLKFLSNQFNPNSGYKLLAYRYIPSTQTGHLLVEGIHKGTLSRVHASLAIAHDPKGFPGVLANIIYWQGRTLTGQNSHVYFNPGATDYPPRLSNLALKSHAPPKDVNRESYLNMLWSGVGDKFKTDRIEGILVACSVPFALPNTAKGKDLGTITTSRDLAGIPGGKDFQASSIKLGGSHEINVDTTNGPVHIYVNGTTLLSGKSKVRNYRTDGQLPQVGDLRIIQTLTKDAPVQLKGQSCIENALIYAPKVEVHLFTTGSECPSSRDSNIIGVVWAQNIENSSMFITDYAKSHSAPKMSGGSQSGIEVPDDVSSLLSDVEAMNLPILYQISSVQTWNNVSL